MINKLLEHMTQRELAERLGLSQAAISMLSNNKRKAGRKTLAGLLRAFPEKHAEILAFFARNNHENEP